MAIARQYHTKQTHYLRKSISYTDDGSEIEVGMVPAGSVINKASSGVHITTAFNASGGNVLDVGTNGGATGASDDPDLFGTDLALGTLGFVPVDEAVSYLLTRDTIITASVALTGTAATQGAAEVVVEFYPDIDG